jgi:hypothetical protein
MAWPILSPHCLLSPARRAYLERFAVGVQHGHGWTQGDGHKGQSSLRCAVTAAFLTAGLAVRECVGGSAKAATGSRTARRTNALRGATFPHLLSS